MSRWAEKYMTLRFADGGREFPAVDCWGLVRLVLARETNAPLLPSYGDVPAHALLEVARSMRDDSTLPPWREISGPLRAFDVAGMRALPGADSPRSAIVHVGILTGPNRLLHIEKGCGVQHVAIDHPTVKSRILAFRRHEVLA